MAPESLNHVRFGDRRYTLDEYGFLYPPEQWDEVFAEGMARLLGVVGGLTPEHWSFVKYLRTKFIEEKTVPLVVQACAGNNLRLRKLALLFPTGYHRGACKIAGINYRFMYENSFWVTCESYVVLKSKYKMTPLGFLESFEQWDPQFAQLIADEWQMPGGLSPKHREILEFLREFYAATRNIPTVFATCKAADIDLDELMALFPAGYHRGACRMAGLPFLP